MERKQLAPGVHLSYDPAEKLNRCRISIHFTFPARRDTATAHALLPLVMERGYAGCPDMTDLTKRLARLYGADLTVDGRPMGANRNLCISVSGIKDRFALAGEDLCGAYLELALGVAFHPCIRQGAFDPEAVAIEKQMLRQSLEDELNDKRLYCMRQAARVFYGDSPMGIRQEGYLEEVEGLDGLALAQAYQEMVDSAAIEVMVLGCTPGQAQRVEQAFLAELAAVCRRPRAVAPFMAMPRQQTVHKTEYFDMVQAKLCMAFTLGRPMDLKEMAAYRLAMALYGGSVTSRLFLHVRERDNLCYYCSSSFQSFTGSMTVNSGVEPGNAARAEEAIQEELADLCTGPITPQELEDCRRGLIAGLEGVEDSLGGLESWYAMEIIRGGPITTPAQARADLAAVTEDQVRAVLRRFSLSVSYLLTRKEGPYV